MLTAQKRKFAVALMSGMSQKDAAIKAGYSEKSARSKGSQLAKDPEVIAFISRKKKEVIETDDVPTYGKKVYTPAVNSPQKKEGAAVPAEGLAVVGQFDDPLQFLMAVMNDSTEDIDTRKDAAKAMLPYVHPKKGETGKKEARNAAAKVAAGVSKFGSMAPPKLVVNNKKG
ncbi:TPA: terminase small subunit [Klebsiella pneumoniae]|uniref:Terminase small subunit n=3 Tax=Klebsiella pneumoniae TaxID=573 RepID=A0A1W1K3B6_KLEPN|nr:MULTISPECIES: terminase small subunit [Klebsiella]DAL27514.1 MAG TPA_asm: TERMINASE SMALL SUBUNIT [Caudoviricetes sp.]HBZ7729295.1 terminase small subunit [Klebsiella variicola subsp. variicola]ANK45199.1 terminase [Klebsiella pneumoniae]EIY5167012.1 terminase small subunit [Klebsiella quasipneumoniae]EKT9139019.1 terminase small subunit [Klebsiella variicola]